MSDLNDPRVFLAAERTLLAWNRTVLSLVAFGFVIKRFGLSVALLGVVLAPYLLRDFSLLMTPLARPCLAAERFTAGLRALLRGR